MPRLDVASEIDEMKLDLPLLSATPKTWAPLAAKNLPVFLADHAICEQQAAMFGLTLVGHYPEDQELVERMSALAAEEVSHLRRVHAILHRRGFKPSRRRANPWVRELRQHLETDRERELKVDRLLLGALIEARSCERFTLLLEEIEGQDPEVARLLVDLGPAEKRHWEMFYQLAQREMEPEELEPRWRRWLEIESEISSKGGREPRVHG